MSRREIKGGLKENIHIYIYTNIHTYIKYVKYIYIYQIQTSNIHMTHVTHMTQYLTLNDMSRCTMRTAYRIPMVIWEKIVSKE